ncbi:carboxypeptidase-like regulatory domain-containing protein [Paludibaculum fermentans]|uniref:carboxypeptidase-like regulatory domain-containing protein n=1 Tax=Paludibaculum fermentans TaxID=1473598 RepID=UPI003EBDDADA
MRRLPLLALLLALRIAAQPPQPNASVPTAPAQPGVELSGRVLNATSGEPVAGAHIVIIHMGPAGRGVGALTDASGRFTAAGLTPGPLYVQATHPNFPGPFGLPQGGTHIDLQPGKQSAEIVLRLRPSGVVSGRVVDDEGEPVSGCEIQMFTVRVGAALSSAGISGYTDDEGNFRLEPVAPDRYLLSARCAEDLPTEHILDVNPARSFESTQTWQRTFYEDSPTFAGATEFGVAAGAQVQLELHLKPQVVRTLKGVLTGPLGTSSKRPAQVYLARTGGGAGPTEYESESVNMEDNSFRFESVVPGTYELSALSWDATSEVRHWALVTLTVGDEEPPRAALSMQPLSVLTGKVETRPGAADVPAAGPAQFPVAPTNPAKAVEDPSPAILTMTPVPRANHDSDQQASVNAHDGSFRFSGITPGRWKIHYYLRRQPAWIESVQYGGATSENQEIEITPGATTTLRIRTSTEFARTRFELKLPSNAPRTYWVVYAVPAQRLKLDAPVVAAIGFPESLSSVTRLPPGPYRFFAVPRTAGGGMFNERFAELMSRTLEQMDISTANEKTIEVRCFLHEEVERIVSSYIAGEVR